MIWHLFLGDLSQREKLIEIQLPLDKRYLVKSFQDTYLGNGIDPPLFPPQLWNVYRWTLQGSMKTNNVVEGWHCWLNKKLAGSEGDLYKFVKVLMAEQTRQIKKNEDWLNGAPDPITQSAKTRRNQKNILSVVVKWDVHKREKTILKYLLMIAAKTDPEHNDTEHLEDNDTIAPPPVPAAATEATAPLSDEEF